uniref:pentapeptide repeat-containing protein n=1 Tax=Paenibacillus sp. FSL R10-2778 TaxID=2954659 RepID=UPI00406CFF1F
MRANPSVAHLTDAYLTDAYLTDAYLTDAYLTDVHYLLYTNCCALPAAHLSTTHPSATFAYRKHWSIADLYFVFGYLL